MIDRPWPPRRFAGSLAAALCLVLAGLWPASAFAHAALVSSAPADGAIVRAAPDVIALHFNEPVAPLVFRLVTPKGETLDAWVATAAGENIDVAMEPEAANGTWSLSWRVISADGHPVGGVVSFSIGMPSGAAVAERRDSSRVALIWALKTLAYLGLFVGVGGVFFQTWFSLRTGDAWLRLPLWTGAVALVASVGGQGLDELDVGMAAIVSPDVWARGASGSFGLSVAIGLAAIACALLTRVGPGRALSAVALALVGATLAATGHAASTPPHWLTRGALFIHGVGLAFWVGALAPLARGLWCHDPDMAAVLRRFSRAALVAVPAVIAAGATLATIQAVGLGALSTTTYGQILLMKLSLFGLLIVLAAGNLLYLTPAVAGGGSSRWLCASIGCEMALVFGILSLVAGWRFTPPPRALAAAAQRTEKFVHLHGETLMANISFEPGVVGIGRARIEVLDENFVPLDAARVALVMAPADGAIEAREFSARRAGEGVFVVEPIAIPTPGVWSATLNVGVDDFTQTRLGGEIEFAK